MAVIVKKRAKKKKRRNDLRIVEIKHVQVPDAEERRDRVFKILMASFENRVGNDNRGR